MHDAARREPGHPCLRRRNADSPFYPQPLVGLNEHFSLFHSIVRRCADFGFTPQFVVKTVESRLIYHFCQERVGIGIGVNIHAAPPPLRYVPITEGTPWRVFFVCKKEKRGDSLFQEIIAALTSQLQR
ncbi:LysR substrate-binding domain-containing protein [uncultured Megasphaera sp.]|uniref:LysR substrate-binding domain-containing protein n=1 Tax=uncultured Megasphaera sp. TaxID=165188 RepID=UPI0034374A26